MNWKTRIQFNEAGAHTRESVLLDWFMSNLQTLEPEICEIPSYEIAILPDTRGKNEKHRRLYKDGGYDYPDRILIRSL